MLGFLKMYNIPSTAQDSSLGFFFGIVEGLVVIFVFVLVMTYQPWFDCSKIFEGSFIVKLLTPLLDYSNKLGGTYA